MTGKPASTPLSVEPRSPFSTAGINSRGTLPPLTASSNSKPEPGISGSNVVFTPGELAGAAGLLAMDIIDIGFAGDGLAIGDLRRADIGVHLELALHAIDDDLEM